jgi:8-oxo-dGTP pyrophosphatase MutT (NUDIX family)
VTPRGGPQVIPRPADAQPGDPPPWHDLPPDRRRIDVDMLRATFTGRIGAPSSVEGTEHVLPSSVLAAFWDHEGSLEVLLTRRSQGLRTHKGEVSFPGGRSDPGEDLRVAALRETAEEVALDTSQVEVLGELDHLMTVTSRSFIVPFVGLLPGRPSGLVPNPSEVDAVLFVPVDELLLDEVYREERWRWDGTDRSIFFFDLVGDTIWGATAAMLRHLLGLALGLGTGIDHR